VNRRRCLRIKVTGDVAELKEVVYVDGAGTAVGRAGPKGFLLADARGRYGCQGRPRAAAPGPHRSAGAIGNVIFAATAQVGAIDVVVATRYAPTLQHPVPP
jgi:hypothetical protein